MTDSIGVAVIGAGMAGRSHAHAYRTAQTVFGTDAPPVRLVAIADINTDFANHARDRYGFERTESSWQAIVDADDIDAVSIVVANHLHREIAEALLASGKHVLCEKPLASTVEDAETMVKAADASGLVAACGFSYRRSPGRERHRRADQVRSTRRDRALQRPVLVRLLRRPGRADELALRGSTRFGGARRSRQSPDRHERAALRPDRHSRWSGATDPDQGPAGAPWRRLGPRRRRSSER